MFVFSIVDNEVKVFMDKLLKEETFDKLEVKAIEIENIVKYEISCNINKEYLQENENRDYVKWSEIKPYIFQLIKGKRKPKVLKIIFMPSKEIREGLHNNAAAMSINLLYENDIVTGTTGTSQKNFSLDKGLDTIWDDTVKKFFKKNNIFVSTHN